MVRALGSVTFLDVAVPPTWWGDGLKIVRTDQAASPGRGGHGPKEHSQPPASDVAVD